MWTTAIFVALLVLAVLGTVLATVRRRRSVHAPDNKAVVQLDREQETR